MDITTGPQSRLFSQYQSRPLADARYGRCSEPACARRPHPRPPGYVHLRLDRDAGEIACTVRSAALCDRAILCRGDKRRPAVI